MLVEEVTERLCERLSALDDLVGGSKDGAGNGLDESWLAENSHLKWFRMVGHIYFSPNSFTLE